MREIEFEIISNNQKFIYLINYYTHSIHFLYLKYIYKNNDYDNTLILFIYLFDIKSRL